MNWEYLTSAVFYSATLYQKGLESESVVYYDSLGGGSHWTAWYDVMMV